MPRFGERVLNVMVTWVGINEHGNRVTDLRQLEFDSEEKLLEWIESAPVTQTAIDPGPDVRIELPPKKF